MIEILGIVATLFVLLAFCMNNEKSIRTIDIIGAILFVIYGIFIQSISVIILNTVLILINLYKLFKE